MSCVPISLRYRNELRPHFLVLRRFRCGLSGLSQANRAGRRVGFDVAEADVPSFDPQLLGDDGALAGEADAGLAAGVFGDFDIRPGDPAAPTGAEDFQHRLLGGESPGQVLEISLGVRQTILLLAGRENAIEKPIGVIFAQPADARRFDDIDAMTDDGHVIAP